MCLGNDNDQIIERMICLLPTTEPDQDIPNNSAVDNTEIWRALSEPDQYGTQVYDIRPLCEMVGITNEDKTIIIDNCRAIHIRWKGFLKPAVQRDSSTGGSLAAMFVIAGAWWLGQGISLTLN